MRFIMVLLLALSVTACATAPPVDIASTDKTITPNRAFADIGSATGKRVAWGGTIINTRNLKDSTEIEVLGYPLDDNARPDRASSPQRRFLLVRDGYLESADYRAGRLVSATGTVTGTRQGMVGDAPYVYPELRAEELHLWPVEEETRRTQPNVHFGIGVGVIFGR